jgi:ABC-2 type transport system permease protein
VTALRALVRKELAILFAAPTAWLTMAFVGLVTALLFFDHLRLYNQILFVYTSTQTGGFELGTVPERVNLQDQVFLPLMEQLTVTLIGVIPLVTMRFFAEERARGTDEWLLTSRLSPAQIVLGKFVSCGIFVSLLLGVALIYPATSLLRAGLGIPHLAAVYVGLLALGLALAAIGLACSAYCSSQLMAAVSAYAIAFLVYDFGWLNPFLGDAAARQLDLLSLHGRFADFAEGMVPLSALVYFAGIVAIGASLARLALDLVRVR